MIQYRPTQPAVDLDDYTDRLWSYVAGQCPELLDAIFGTTA